MSYYHQEWAQMIEVVNNLIVDYRSNKDDEIISKIRKICLPIEESYKYKLPEHLRDDFESIYLEKLWLLIAFKYDISKCTFFSLLKKVAKNDYIRILTLNNNDVNVFNNNLVSFDSNELYENDQIFYNQCSKYVQDVEDIVISKYDRPDYVDKFTPTERKVYESAKDNIVRTSRPDRFNLFHVSVKDVANDLNYNRAHTITVYLSSIKRKIREEIEGVV